MKTLIIIPIYKDILVDKELMCLNRNINIFKDKEICFIHPKSLNIQFYLRFNVSRFEAFDDSCFNSIESYNRLMVDINFWDRFNEYDYILICQTDAFVFYDDLERWVNYGYDYIGAPWMDHIFDKHVGDLFHNVGNGGFSLRKVNTYIKILERNNNLVNAALKNCIYEDVLLSLFFKKEKIELNIPTYDIASEFSIETTRFLDKSNLKLPFGSHKLWHHDNKLFEDLLKITNT